MPAMKVIFKYDHISPLITYMSKVLMHGTLYMCGSKPEMGPSNSFFTVPLIRNEFPIVVNKKDLFKYVFHPIMAQVMNRLVIVMCGEITGSVNRTISCNYIIT